MTALARLRPRRPVRPAPPGPPNHPLLGVLPRHAAGGADHIVRAAALAARFRGALAVPSAVPVLTRPHRSNPHTFSHGA